MSRNIVFLICACLASLGGQAQINFVLNPQFENYSSCPTHDDEAKYCTHWWSLDTSWNPPDFAHAKAGIPEYCNVCATGINNETAIPVNDRFHHASKSGRGMMQVQMYCNSVDSLELARDYLQGHLVSTLLSGHSYQVVLHTCAEQGSNCNINNIGAYFDDGSIDSTVNPGWTQSRYTPQILDTNVISDTLNWTKIEGMFTSNGTEKYITIGNFSDRFSTRAVPFISTSFAAFSWYLIEDVSVIDCDNIPYAGHDTVIHPGDSAFLGSHEGLLPYTWYKLGDTTPITTVNGTSGIMVRPTVTTSYVLKQELCKVARWDTVKVWVWPDTPSHVGVEQLALTAIHIYPNPAVEEIIVEGAKGYTVGVFDILGRCVVPLIAATDKAVLPTQQLAIGVYFVRIIDEVTGEVVVRRVMKE